jgi:hypothetical protein
MLHVDVVNVCAARSGVGRTKLISDSAWRQFANAIDGMIGDAPVSRGPPVADADFGALSPKEH